jgi:exopolysaccharide production protein ExoZ
MVVLLHSTEAVNQYFGGISSNMIYTAKFGVAGVHIFFVISGFIMVYTSFYPRNTEFSSGRFLLRRFVRIFPIYWVYCLLYLLYRHFFGPGYTVSNVDIFGSFLLLPGYSPVIIGPGWTLAYEVYFYLCFGLAMILGLKRGIIVLALFFLSSIALGLVFQAEGAAARMVSNSLLVEFLFGAGLAYVFLKCQTVSVKLAVTMQVLALAGFLSSYLIGYERFPSVIVWGIPSAALVAGLAFAEKNGQIFGWIRKCSFLGDSSYSLYLIHILLIDILLTAYRTSVAVPSSGNPVMWGSLTAFSILVAFALYELVERNLVSSLQDLARQRITWMRRTTS